MLNTRNEIIEILNALEAGKMIQFQYKGWWDFKNPGTNEIPDFKNFSYRIKPQAPVLKRIPLTQADIPAVCWLREAKTPNNIGLVVGFDRCWLHFWHREMGVSPLSYHNASIEYEFSSDRINWKPMYKEVEE